MENRAFQWGRVAKRPHSFQPPREGALPRAESLPSAPDRLKDKSHPKDTGDVIMGEEPAFLNFFPVVDCFRVFSLFPKFAFSLSVFTPGGRGSGRAAGAGARAGRR